MNFLPMGYYSQQFGGSYGTAAYPSAYPPMPPTTKSPTKSSSAAATTSQTSYSSYSATSGSAMGTGPSAAGSGGATGASLTGYDAAVYAAATSYLQSKSTGNSKQWMKKGGGGTGGNFPRKGGPGGGGVGGVRTAQLYYCEICKISTAGSQTYREHLEGQKHKKKEELLKSGDKIPVPRNKTCFRCEVCSVTCTGQDTYNAHVRGKSHQKALKLQSQLGKPMPSTEPTVISSKNSSMSTGGGGGGGSAILTGSNKIVVGIPKVNWVGGQTLHTTTTGSSAVPVGPVQPTANSAQSMETGDNEPAAVGDAYIEPEYTGSRQTGYHCKLCDCSFTDLAAKNIHAKGRRHRLNYKKKVDPSLEVEPEKGSSRFMSPAKRKAEAMRARKELMRARTQQMNEMRAAYSVPIPAPTGPAVPLFPSSYKSTHSFYNESPDNTLGWMFENDNYVMTKHNLIYPTDVELQTIQNMVTQIEKALKNVSDKLAEPKPAEQSAANGESTGTGETTTTPAVKSLLSPDERTLKGVMRVGNLAKGLLLRGEMTVQLVLLSSEMPTASLLSQVHELLKLQFESAKYVFSVLQGENAILVSCAEPVEAKLLLTLTSIVAREPGDTPRKPDPADVLSLQKCLRALEELRHAKWFQARCGGMQSCLVILRIMRDLCKRVPTWTPLSSWALELLVEKILSGSGMSLSPGEAFRRIFEAVGSGILLPNGVGLMDPCEKEPVDALASMNPQQREDITASAQHALRLVAFNQVHKVLGIELLPCDGGLDPEAAKKSIAEEEDKAPETEKTMDTS